MAAMPFDLVGVIVPVLTATIVMAGGAFAVRRYAGPAQAAYVAAIEGRMKVLQTERDELRKQVDDLRAELVQMRHDMAELERQVRELTAENLQIRRQLPAHPPNRRQP